MTRRVAARRRGASLVALTMASALVLLAVGQSANAVLVATVPLLTSVDYAVLGSSTVTNTGPSIIDNNVGLWPGSSVTGFPPGLVIPPATIQAATAAADQAQIDSAAAYTNAAGRPVDTTLTNGNLDNRTLTPGVYEGPSKAPLFLTGPLILDGANDPNSVFIFQTDSTLVTASSSTVTLINGAQECNVFWQVGSSATLGTNSVFAGTILALISITATTGVTVHGRALAQNGAVTLDTNTFTKPTCDLTPPTTTTTAGATTTTAGATTTTTGATTTTTGATTTTTGATTTTTAPAGTTSTIVPAAATTSTVAAAGASTSTTAAGSGTATTTTAAPRTPIDLTSARPGVPGVVGPPQTGAAPLRSGSSASPAVLFAGLLAVLATTGPARRRRARARAA